VGERKNIYKILAEKPERKKSLGSRTILKWILDKKDGVIWTGLIWLLIGTSGGLL
jgi:hypothetical protein